ncbi:MAG: RidA family protein [Gammaproteobacteria bacterium]|nr:RidA family protein [Gammaproteobacteria bacterium]MDE0284005.1 RidA family protein [Gammaproteobacteria bacterium]MDE0510485.1 RidA family protein [Gammaproteobacteria bacterium]
MVSKTAVNNANAPDMSSFFNWGLKIRDMEELFLITGRPAWTADGSVISPNDPVAQTKYILDDIERYMRENGYTPEDLIRIEYTFTTAVPKEKYQEVFGLFAGFLQDVEVKPAACTLRIVDSLGLEGLCVEYEFWAAK